MKTLARCLLCLSLVFFLAGCELLSSVVQDVQKGVSDVQTQVEGAVKATTDTIETTKKKVEDVSNAAAKLKESLDNLTE